MDMYFKTNYTPEEVVKTLSKCNKGHFMKYEKNSKKLSCEMCNIELSLPEVDLYFQKKIFFIIKASLRENDWRKNMSC